MDAPKQYLGTNRLEALVDGTFAIAMTILIFDLKVPEIAHEATQTQLVPALLKLLPNFIVYIVSFIMLGVYWIGQHNTSKFIQRTDRTFLWLSIGFLATVVLIPFSTALLAHYGNDQAVEIIYGANLLLIGMLSYIQWEYANWNHRLVDHAIPRRIVQAVRWRIAMAPLICIVAILASFVSTGISLWAYMLIPMYYIMPSEVDEYWKPSAERHED